MKIIITIALFCLSLWAQAQISSKEILERSEAFYSNKSSGKVIYQEINKNVLKEDTVRVNKTFIFEYKGDQIAILRSNTSNFLIFNGSTSYNISAGNKEFAVAKRSDEILRFIPYWKPSVFFRRYKRMNVVSNVKVGYLPLDSSIVLNFSNKRDYHAEIVFNRNNYRILSINETIKHPKFGNQYKGFVFIEEDSSYNTTGIKYQLDSVLNNYINVSGYSRCDMEKHNEAIRKRILNTKVEMPPIISLLNIGGVNKQLVNARFILLDFYFQACLPCLKAVPELNNLHSTFDSSILQVVGINPRLQEAGKSGRFVKKHNNSLPGC